MSIGTQSQTDSVYLSSSVSSLHRPKKAFSEISKTYKHASQLYLTRRLIECYDALQPVIRPVAKVDTRKENGHVSQSEDDAIPRAPIASASTSQRIKIWSLYVTLLNTIIELGDEEGKRDFGNKVYRDIVRNVQSGEVWEQVVRDGYMNREASVDAEVVYNLSNLLLGQAPNQTVNQTRLETYLSSSPQGSIDFSSAFQPNGKSHTNGMDTPRDLNSRVKILELFVLHVLPANNEWDYARSFVTNSDILDEERREAFLQTLNELQEVKEQEEAEAAAEQDLVGFAQETEDEDTQHDPDRIQMNDDDDDIAHNHIDGDTTNHHHEQTSSRKFSHRRTSSEVDYGIDDDGLKSRSPPSQTKTDFQSPPQSTATTKATSVSTRTESPAPSPPPPSITSATSKSAASPPAQSTRKPSIAPAKKSASMASNKPNTNKSSNSHSSQLSKIIRIITNLTSAITTSLTRNPTQVFQTIMFLFAFLVVLARKDVRERLKRMLGSGWLKLRQTAGMGVRVSYV